MIKESLQEHFKKVKQDLTSKLLLKYDANCTELEVQREREEHGQMELTGKVNLWFSMDSL